MQTYNGWANEATWRVNLEMLDGYDVTDWLNANRFVFPDDRIEAVEALASHFEDLVHELVEIDAQGFALDLARDYLRQVDWEEIAAHYIDDHISL
jgi:hypothetical protein